MEIVNFKLDYKIKMTIIIQTKKKNVVDHKYIITFK
jgi:hypothetical protein